MPRAPRKIYVEPLIARPVKEPTRRKPHWYWRVEVHREGRTATVWSGRAERSELQQHMAQLVANRSWDRAPVGEAGQEVVTVSHLLRAWMYAVNRRPDLAPATRQAYRGHKRRLDAELGQIVIDALSLRALEKYRDRRLAAGSATSTVKQDLTILRIAWRWGWERGATPSESLPKVPIRVSPARTRHMPGRRDAWAVVSRAQGYVRTALHIQWAYGCRVSECTSIQPMDVDLERGRLRLISRIHAGRDGKTGARWVPLVPSVRQLLEPMVEGRGPSELLLGVQPSTARRRVINELPTLCEAAGVQRFTSHGFRHAIINEMLDRGVDIKTIAAWSGNSPETIWRSYTRAGGANLEEAALAVRAGEAPRRNDTKVVQFPHGSPARLADDDV